MSILRYFIKKDECITHKINDVVDTKALIANITSLNEEKFYRVFKQKYYKITIESLTNDISLYISFIVRSRQALASHSDLNILLKETITLQQFFTINGYYPDDAARYVKMWKKNTIEFIIESKKHYGNLSDRNRAIVNSIIKNIDVMTGVLVSFKG